MATVIDIADAVVAELADGTFSQGVSPVRRVLPEYDLAALTELRVTVVPKQLATEGASRTLSQHDYGIDVGIQKKLGKDLDSEVAGLCTLVEEIAEFLTRRTLQAMPQAVWVRSSNDPIYAPDHLADQRTFTSVLTLTYRIVR